jgi:hypothetical protein
MVLLVNWKELRVLNLAKTSITNSGLIDVKALSQLQSLALRETQIGDAGLEQLTTLNRLETVWLEQTSVSKAGASKLRDALPKCRIYGP